MMFLFVSDNANKYIIYTLIFFLNDHNKVDLLFIVKTKTRNFVEIEVVKDNNNELTKQDDVFQIDEVVDTFFLMII
jgi:hypothetical protein